MRVRTRVAGAAALAVGSIAGPAGTGALGNAPEAGAYPILNNVCHFPTLLFVYSGGNWSTEQRNRWDAGAAQWNGVRDQHGGSWWLSGTGNYHNVYRVDLPYAMQGYTECDITGSLYFQLDTAVSGEMINDVAGHEAGHGHGLQHTGDDDTLPSHPSAPLMATCVGTRDRALLGDSTGAIAERMSNTVHPNASFENALYFWNTSGGSLSLYGESASEGFLSAQFEATAAGQSIYNDVRNATSPTSYRTRVNYKDNNNAASGTLTMQLQARPVAYPTSGPSECGFVNGWDFNSAWLNNGSTYFNVGPSTQVAVGDDWSYNGVNSAWTDATGWQGVDLRLRIYKNTPTPLFVDYARAYSG